MLWLSKSPSTCTAHYKTLHTMFKFNIQQYQLSDKLKIKNTVQQWNIKME